MKNSKFSIALFALIITSLASCNKSEGSASYDQAMSSDQKEPSSLNDSISSAATFQIKNKQFIKSADVNMEVQDVYDATIFIEKTLQDLGGFVTSSKLQSQIISEKTFTISDEDAMLVRQYQSENEMQVRVPTAKLGELLHLVNDKKIFLNSRVILAEDVTANIEMSKLEEIRNNKTRKNIEKLSIDKDKVTLSDANESEGNYQKLSSLNMQDQLEYSSVHIFLKEFQPRIAQISVANMQNIDRQYQYNFFYDAKNAVIEGFYLIQKIILGLLQIWPLIIVGATVFYFYKKRKPFFGNSKPVSSLKKNL